MGASALLDLSSRAVFLAGLVMAQFASGLAAQASASRLLYAMGRDSVLPKAVFGRLREKFHTPVANLVVTGIVGLIAIFLDVATSTSFINFGKSTSLQLGQSQRARGGLR